jgi:hypothetical protein
LGRPHADGWDAPGVVALSASRRSSGQYVNIFVSREIPTGPNTCPKGGFEIRLYSTYDIDISLKGWKAKSIILWGAISKVLLLAIVSTQVRSTEIRCDLVILVVPWEWGRLI